MTTIIETLSGQFYMVRDHKRLSNAWSGIEVKQTQTGWRMKANAKPVLVRKTGTWVVATTEEVE